MRTEQAAFIDETCSVAWSMSIGELHEPVYAPFALDSTRDRVATRFRDGTSEAGWWSRPGRLHQPAWSELGGGEGVDRAGAIERGARRTAGAAPRVAGGPVGRAWRGYGAAAQGGSHRTRAPVRVELADERRHSGGMRRRHRRTADPDPAVAAGVLDTATGGGQVLPLSGGIGARPAGEDAAERGAG